MRESERFAEEVAVHLVAAVAALRGERAEGIKHPAVALARAVKSDAGRKAAGLYSVHGSVLLQRAMEARIGVALVLYTPRFLVGPAATAAATAVQRLAVPHVLISEGIMRTIVERAYLPDVIALIERRVLAPTDLTIHRQSLLLLANDLTNPSNLGMLVRTAYGSGVDALLLSSGTTDPFVWQVSTGSTGAIFHLPVVAPVQPADLVQIKAQGVRTIAAVAGGEQEYTAADYRGPTCIVVGNEAHGLSPVVASLCDVAVRIPMVHHLDSLNVAVAAGVLLFEAQRQRRAAATSGRV